MQRKIGSLSWLVATLVVAACAGTVTSTVTPSATATDPTGSPGSATPEPIPSPSATTSSTPSVIPTPACQGGAPGASFKPDSIVCVVEGPLRVRSKPNTSDASRKLTPLLETGQLLFVIDGPERGSDYGWYLLSPITEPFTDAGWVAAADHDGTPWLAPATVSCPAEPSLDDLAGMQGPLRVHCYGDRAFTFTDTVHWGAMCGDPTFLHSPPFMSDCWSVFFWGDNYSNVLLAVPPDLTEAVGPREAEDTIEATIVAHMDDAAAQQCEADFYEEMMVDPLVDRLSTILGCRSTFVATSFERLSP